jgi:hypothetical protein
MTFRKSPPSIPSAGLQSDPQAPSFGDWFTNDDSPWLPKGAQALQVTHQTNSSQGRALSLGDCAGPWSSNLGIIHQQVHLPLANAYAMMEPEAPQPPQEEIKRLLLEQDQLDLKYTCEKREIQKKITSLLENFTNFQSVLGPECHGTSDSTLSDSKTGISNRANWICPHCHKGFKTKSESKYASYN